MSYCHFEAYETLKHRENIGNYKLISQNRCSGNLRYIEKIVTAKFEGLVSGVRNFTFSENLTYVFNGESRVHKYWV